MVNRRLLMRILASGFVAAGSASGVIWLWPEEIVVIPLARWTLGLVLKAVGAVLSAAMGLYILWTFWTD
jgi:hypothetical protein